jgi:membrane protein YqaA with SNARE-associated domain
MDPVCANSSKSFLDWYLAALDAGGYPLITFLMALESSIVPLPSEVVIPPAAYVAHTRGTMSLAGIVVAGTVGSWLGATAMYWAARLLGRPLLMRYGRYVMVTPEKIEQAEIWSGALRRHGNLHLAAAARDPPSDRNPGGHRADGLSEVLRRHRRGIGALVLGAGVGRRDCGSGSGNCWPAACIASRSGSAG